MALTYDFTKVEDFDALREDDNERVINDMIVWATVFVDMGEITKDNYLEFAKRVHMWEKANGALSYRDGESYYLTPEDVRKRIGLRTNVSKKTPAQYRTKIGKALEREAEAWVARRDDE